MAIIPKSSCGAGVRLRQVGGGASIAIGDLSADDDLNVKMTSQKRQELEEIFADMRQRAAQPDIASILAHHVVERVKATTDEEQIIKDELRARYKLFDKTRRDSFAAHIELLIAVLSIEHPLDLDDKLKTADLVWSILQLLHEQEFETARRSRTSRPFGAADDSRARADDRRAATAAGRSGKATRDAARVAIVRKRLAEYLSGHPGRASASLIANDIYSAVNQDIAALPIEQRPRPYTKNGGGLRKLIKTIVQADRLGPSTSDR